MVKISSLGCDTSLTGPASLHTVIRGLLEDPTCPYTLSLLYPSLQGLSLPPISTISIIAKDVPSTCLSCIHHYKDCPFESVPLRVSSLPQRLMSGIAVSFPNLFAHAKVYLSSSCPILSSFWSHWLCLFGDIIYSCHFPFSSFCFLQSIFHL